MPRHRPGTSASYSTRATSGSTFTCKDRYSPEDTGVHVNEPGIGADHARRCVDAYIDAWNEPQADKRRQILTQVMTDDCAYADPTKRLDSRTGLDECIDEILGKDPGRRIVRTSEVDAHNLFCRFNWRMVKTDSTHGPESIDFVEFAEDGRIRRVTGFFGPLTSTKAL